MLSFQIKCWVKKNLNISLVSDGKLVKWTARVALIRRKPSVFHNGVQEKLLYLTQSIKVFLPSSAQRFGCTVLFKASFVCRLNAPLTEKNSQLSGANKNQFTSTVLAVDSVGLKPFVSSSSKCFWEKEQDWVTHHFFYLHCSGIVFTGLAQLTPCYTSCFYTYHL